MSKLKLAIIGTQGIPAKYGGFETLVEYLAEYLSCEFEITVYCSSKIYDGTMKEYKGCRLEYVPFHANGIQSIPFDIYSILKALKKFDKILVLGASGGVIMPLLKKYRKKFILNFGGLDWKRSKWSRTAQKFLKISEALAVKNSAQIISDNDGIKSYIKNEYNRESELITYGGDQAFFVEANVTDLENYPFLNKPYAFSVARIQPDNNIEILLQGFQRDSTIPIVLVGNWHNSEFGKKIKLKYSGQKEIILIDAIYDQRILNLLRSNCKMYIHGHSAGGTNPSLIEAMYLGLPIFAFSSGFNEYTTENKALYFSDEYELKNMLKKTDDITLKKIGLELKNIATNKYRWKIIAQKYKIIIER